MERMCRGCKYWYSGMNQCRRRAPTAASIESSRWPAAYPEESCGEWQAQTSSRQDFAGHKIESGPEPELMRSVWWGCRDCGMLQPFDLDAHHCAGCRALREHQVLTPCDFALGRHLYRIWYG